jgi:hypothetical protein
MGKCGEISFYRFNLQLLLATTCIAPTSFFFLRWGVQNKILCHKTSSVSTKKAVKGDTQPLVGAFFKKSADQIIFMRFGDYLDTRKNFHSP